MFPLPSIIRQYDKRPTSLHRHRHHPNHPWGPHFEENIINVTVREFQTIHLDCRVGLIEDKLVSGYVCIRKMHSIHFFEKTADSLKSRMTLSGLDLDV